MATVPLSYPEREGNFDANIIRSLLTNLCFQSTESLESDNLEIKSWCRDEKELAEKVSDVAACLANATGGLLLVGVSDESGGGQKFSPCPYPNVTRQWLTARIQDLTYPPVECAVHDVSDILSQVISAAGRSAFAVQVPKKKCFGSHLTAKGISRIRVGKECRPHFSAEDDFSRIPVVDLTEHELSLGSIEWGIAQHPLRTVGWNAAGKGSCSPGCRGYAEEAHGRTRELRFWPFQTAPNDKTRYRDDLPVRPIEPRSIPLGRLTEAEPLLNFLFWATIPKFPDFFLPPEG